MQLLRPQPCSFLGYELFGYELYRQGRRSLLRVYIDAEKALLYLTVKKQAVKLVQCWMWKIQLMALMIWKFPRRD